MTAGDPGFTLTVNGSGFSSGVNVVWSNPDNPDSGAATAALVSASQATKPISAADIAIPGTVQVTVANPLSVQSNVLSFVIKPGPAGGAQTVLTGANGATPNGNSHDPVLSFNGRFVAFSSEATNLISPNANFPQGYVRDTCLGVSGPPPCTPTTLLVSAVTGGTAASPTEGNSLGGATPSIGTQGFLPPSGAGIPPAGRFVGFISAATNLVAPNTTLQQAYVRDTCEAAITAPGCTPATLLVSVTQSGTEPNGAASELTFAPNSCNAAFVSAGTNVVSGVTIPNEIYRAACTTNFVSGGFTTSATPVSASTSGVAGDQGGQQPAISADGRWVAFASSSTNLTSTPNGGMQQIYLRDTCTPATTSCSPSTTLVSLDNAGNLFSGFSQLPAISDDGRFVAFTTQVPLMLGVTFVVNLRDTCNSSSGMVANCTASTTTISVAAGGGAASGPSNSRPHAISGDGRIVVFDSSATNLVTPATSGNQVFVRDTCKSSSGTVPGCTPSTVLISIDSQGNPTGGFNAAISDDGHFAAYIATINSVGQILITATGF